MNKNKFLTCFTSITVIYGPVEDSVVLSEDLRPITVILTSLAGADLYKGEHWSNQTLQDVHNACAIKHQTEPEKVRSLQGNTNLATNTILSTLITPGLRVLHLTGLLTESQEEIYQETVTELIEQARGLSWDVDPTYEDPLFSSDMIVLNTEELKTYILFKICTLPQQAKLIKTLATYVFNERISLAQGRHFEQEFVSEVEKIKCLHITDEPCSCRYQRGEFFWTQWSIQVQEKISVNISTDETSSANILSSHPDTGKLGNIIQLCVSGDLQNRLLLLAKFLRAVPEMLKSLATD